MCVVANASYNAAKHLADMDLEAKQVRVRLQKGMERIITIFDPQTVKKNSTYAHESYLINDYFVSNINY